MNLTRKLKKSASDALFCVHCRRQLFLHVHSKQGASHAFKAKTDPGHCCTLCVLISSRPTPVKALPLLGEFLAVRMTNDFQMRDVFESHADALHLARLCQPVEAVVEAVGRRPEKKT